MSKLQIYLLVLFLQGCSLFISNEKMTSLIMTEEDRMNSFKENMDWRVGKPYYSKLAKDCITDYECINIDDNIVTLTGKGNPDIDCVIRTYVDTSKKGLYKHPNGYEFDINGIIIKWEYVSKPNNCLVTINWWGPW